MVRGGGRRGQGVAGGRRWNWGRLSGETRGALGGDVGGEPAGNEGERSAPGRQNSTSRLLTRRILLEQPDGVDIGSKPGRLSDAGAPPPRRARRRPYPTPPRARPFAGQGRRRLPGSDLSRGQHDGCSKDSKHGALARHRRRAPRAVLWCVGPQQTLSQPPPPSPTLPPLLSRSLHLSPPRSDRRMPTLPLAPAASIPLPPLHTHRLHRVLFPVGDV